MTQPSNQAFNSYARISEVQKQTLQKISTKYCTCENFLTINEINRAIADKESVLKTTLNDIKFDKEEETMEKLILRESLQSELADLIEYYKYYSQQSVIFHKELFPMLYHHQEKRKLVEYKRLKVLLDLSDSNPEGSPDQTSCMAVKNQPNQQESPLLPPQRPQSQFNFMDELQRFEHRQESPIDSLNQESFLIKRLRNNMSKHIGPSKKLSIEELDKKYAFSKKHNLSSKVKENKFFLTAPIKKSVAPKQSQNFKGKGRGVGSREQTRLTTPDQSRPRSHFRKSAARNRSCQNFIKPQANVNPYEASKLRRKKNLSMDNLQSELSSPLFHTHTSTPYHHQEWKQHKKESQKGKKSSLNKTKNDVNWEKGRQKSQINRMGQKENDSSAQDRLQGGFVSNLLELKNKIQKEKKRMLKNNPKSCGSNLSVANITSIKRNSVNSGLNSQINQRDINLPFNQMFNKRNANMKKYLSSDFKGSGVANKITFC